jgi:hypothetical protein
MAWRSPNIDQVAQRGSGLTIKLRALGGTIIELSKKQPLFVHHLSTFLSFESLKNLGIPLEKKLLAGASYRTPYHHIHDKLALGVRVD